MAVKSGAGGGTTDVIACPSSDTGWPDDSLDWVQLQLAAYDGDDIWADVITRLEGYDAAATALLEPVCAVPVFVVDRIGYQWCSELGVWQAFDAAAEIGGAMNDPLVAGIARASVPWRRRARTDRNLHLRQPIRTLLSFFGK